MDAAGSTRDHHVPHMYLRRFARPTSNGHRIGVRSRDLTPGFVANIRDVAVKRGFYWGTDDSGVPHHHMEELLTALEGSAATAFRSILDSGRRPDDDALPRWPPRAPVRFALAWWISAQILRTVRQRTRLIADADRASIELPNEVAVANEHLRYIAEMIEPFAATVFSRPWGIGFSDFCLLTGDVPVLVLNGQDHRDQRASVEFWDLYLPLDPHRCLYLPGAASVAADAQLRRDHRFKLHAGHALGLNSVMLDSSVKHVFYHPDHDATARSSPALDLEKNMLRYWMEYNVLGRDMGVERRWLDVHPEPRPDTSADGSGMPEHATIALVERVMAELDHRSNAFRKAGGG